MICGMQRSQVRQQIVFIKWLLDLHVYGWYTLWT